MKVWAFYPNVMGPPRFELGSRARPELSLVIGFFGNVQKVKLSDMPKNFWFFEHVHPRLGFFLEALFSIKCFF